MAKTVAVEEAPLVDLSPEATEVRQNLANAGSKIIDKGRVQAVVEDWRERRRFVQGINDNKGMPIPMPEIPVTDKWVAVIEHFLVPIIQDCCDDSEQVIIRKFNAERHLDTDSARLVERLATALAPLRGQLTVPPTPSR